MDKIEKIKKWAQKQMELYWDKLPDADDEHPTEMQLRYLGQYMAYESMESFLDTLSEEPDKSLEEAGEEYGNVKHPMTKTGAKESKEDFIAGAEWQKKQDEVEKNLKYLYGMDEGARILKEQMLKEAVEGEVMTNGFYPYEPRIVASYPNCPYNFGDKVRIAVLKEEDE